MHIATEVELCIQPNFGQVNRQRRSRHDCSVYNSRAADGQTCVVDQSVGRRVGRIQTLCVIIRVAI